MSRSTAGTSARFFQLGSGPILSDSIETDEGSCEAAWGFSSGGEIPPQLQQGQYKYTSHETLNLNTALLTEIHPSLLLLNISWPSLLEMQGGHISNKEVIRPRLATTFQRSGKTQGQGMYLLKFGGISSIFAEQNCCAKDRAQVHWSLYWSLRDWSSL